MIGLAGEGLAFYLFGKEPNQLLTGGQITLVIGPVLTSTIERYRANRQKDDPPSPPSSTSQGDQPEIPPDPPKAPPFDLMVAT